MPGLVIKKHIQHLIDAIKNSEYKMATDDLETVERLLTDCSGYVDRVIAMEAAISLARFRMEPEDYREHVMSLDKQRKYAHDAIIVGIRLLNRLCKLYKVEKIYTGDEESRLAVADFAIQLVNEYFEDRKK